MRAPATYFSCAIAKPFGGAREVFCRVAFAFARQKAVQISNIERLSGVDAKRSKGAEKRIHLSGISLGRTALRWLQSGFFCHAFLAVLLGCGSAWRFAARHSWPKTVEAFLETIQKADPSTEALSA